MENKIDIHKSSECYARTRDKFLSDNSISRRNRELISSFLNDCELGKTLKKRQKKVIKARRLLKYIYHLKFVTRCVEKDFDKLEMKDMEKFIFGLEKDTLQYIDRDGQTKIPKYSPETKRDIKVALRKFYKWLWGNCEKDPEITAWFDTSIEEKEPDSLEEKEIEKLVSFAPGIKEKAMVWTLFETGARAEEFLNVRIRHITDKGTHFTVRIEYPKTYKRSPPVFEAVFRVQGVSYLKKWLEIHPKKNDPHAQLFSVHYRWLCDFLKDLGKRALNKPVTPQLLRDSRATFLAKKKVGRYQMCKLMGWTMSSRMPDRYIDRAGVSEEEAIEAIRKDDLAKAEGENLELKRKFMELEKKYEEMNNISVARGKADNVMTRLLMDEEVQKILAKKIKELNLAKDILNA